MPDDKKPDTGYIDLERLVNMIENYTDYENSLVLTPEDVAYHREMENFDYEVFESEYEKNSIDNTNNQDENISSPTIIIINPPGNFDE